LRAAGVSLPAIDEDCELLTRYAVATRYGSLDSYDEDSAKTTVVAAGRIAAAIDAVLH
jgi:hypothetical protein